MKLVIDNISTTVKNINEIIKLHYEDEIACERIFFVGSEFSLAGMNALYDNAHFYLCTSSTEGLNMPIIESANRGVIPITPFNSAMSTYLDHSCAINIEFKIEFSKKPLHYLSSLLQVTHFPVDVIDIERAIVHANNLSNREIYLMSNNCKNKLRKYFGIEKFREQLKKLVLA